MRVLGLDAGGTKTMCYLADEHAAVIAEARGPGANFTAAGVEGVKATLRQVIEEALAGRSRELAAVCLGMAGVDRAGEKALIGGLLHHLVNPSRIAIVNDALVALEAGAPGQAGIVLISGTGSIAYGRDDHGRAARSGGWGHVLADEGSGYWLGRQALRAVMREADGRGQPTLLTDRLLTHYQARRAQDLVSNVYTGALKPAAIATLASIVQAAADAGDPVASTIIETGATELTAAVLAVARRLELVRPVVVLAGGIFRAVSRMRTSVTTQVLCGLPDAIVTPLDAEPALGAVRLALRVAAGEAVVPTYLPDAR